MLLSIEFRDIEFCDIEFRERLRFVLDFFLYRNISMRYRRIFDIIELLRKSILELQIKFLCMHFED